MRFDGKVAVVTGGGRGMGKAVALLLAKEGASVAIFDILEEHAISVANEISSLGSKALSIRVDVSSPEEVRKAFLEVDQKLGEVDILVNAAGIQRVASILDEDVASWNRVIDVNLTGTFLCCKEACKRMIPKRCGKIVNFGSAAGLVGVQCMLSYSASKFGVIGFTQALALEVGKYGINVNAVCPGCVDTDMWRETREGFARYTGKSPEEQFQETASSAPLGRVGNVDDIARVVAFLCSDDASYVTAQSISVCGGMRPH
ncbi:MAG: SDR family oxidoreductase [Candidatus Caldatribacterium sp.]|nr:SDR family oxidoreductase [Candidatus Caldatribacterium sp.]